MNSLLNMTPEVDSAGIANSISQSVNIRNSSQNQSKFASFLNDEFAIKGEAQRHSEKNMYESSFENNVKNVNSDKYLFNTKPDQILLSDKRKYAEEHDIGRDEIENETNYNEGFSTDINTTEPNPEEKIEEAPLTTENEADNQANESGKEKNESQLKDQANSNEKGGGNETQIDQSKNENTADDDAEDGQPQKKVSSENGLKAALIIEEGDTAELKNSDVPAIEEEAAEEEFILKDIVSEETDEEGDIDVKKEISGKTEQVRDIPRDLKGENNDSEPFEADQPDEGEGTKTISNRVMSEFAGDFSQEKGFHRYSTDSSASQSSRGEAETFDINNVMSSASAASESGKSIGSLLASNSARTAGFNELINNIVYVVKSNNKLGVTINHKQFGKLNIKLSMEQGIINVHVNASDKAVKETLENNINNIIDILKDEGVTVGGFSVALKEEKDNNERFYIVNGNSKDEDKIENKKANANGGIGLVSVFA